MTSAYEDALAIGSKLGWVCVPLVERDGRWVPPFSYSHLFDAVFDVAVFEEIWRGHEDAEGLGAIWPKDVVAIDCDSPEATEWIRRQKLPRTVAFTSRRGPHLLYRGTGEGLNPEPYPKCEVLSYAGGKRLLVLPPSGGKRWMPSLGLFEQDFTPVPEVFKGAALPNGKRERVKLGVVIPEGSRTNEMTRIVGSFVRTMTPEAALTAAIVHDRTYCKPPLGEERIRRMVEDFVAKDAVVVVKEPSPPSGNGLPWTLAEEESGSDEEEEPIVADLVYPGSKTLCISLPKVGKSTYAVGMCAAIRSGVPFLGRTTEPATILYLTEEPRTTFEETLRRAGIDGHDPGFQYIRRGMAGVAGMPWPKIVAATFAHAKDIGAELVVVDVLHRWAGFVDGGENASDKVNEAIGELTPLSEAGIAVWILAHSPWGKKRVRGSTDLFGAVDDGWFIDGEAGSSGPRRIEWVGGRHEPAQSATAYTLNEDRQLESRGSQTMAQASRTQRVIDAVRTLGTPSTTAAVAEELEISEWTARRWLDRALRFGFVAQDTGSHAEFLWRARRPYEWFGES